MLPSHVNNQLPKIIWEKFNLEQMKSPRKLIGIIVAESNRRPIPGLRNFPPRLPVLRKAKRVFLLDSIDSRNAQMHNTVKYNNINE